MDYNVSWISPINQYYQQYPKVTFLAQQSNIHYLIRQHAFTFSNHTDTIKLILKHFVSNLPIDHAIAKLGFILFLIKDFIHYLFNWQFNAHYHKYSTSIWGSSALLLVGWKEEYYRDNERLWLNLEKLQQTTLSLLTWCEICHFLSSNPTKRIVSPLYPFFLLR